MVENNKPAFSVDDILNEVRAMRGQPPVGNTKVTSDEPKKSPGAEKTAADSIIPADSSSQTENKTAQKAHEDNRSFDKPGADRVKHEYENKTASESQKTVKDKADNANKAKPQYKTEPQTDKIHKSDENKADEKNGGEKSGPKNIDELSISDALNDIIKKTKPVASSDKQNKLVKEPPHKSHKSKKSHKKHGESDNSSENTELKVKADDGVNTVGSEDLAKTESVKEIAENKPDKSKPAENKSDKKPQKNEPKVIDEKGGRTDDLPQKPQTISRKPNVITADELNSGFEEKPFHVNRKRRPKVITPEEIKKSADTATLQFSPEDLKNAGDKLTPHEKAVKQVDSLYGVQDSETEGYEFETKAERKQRLKQEKIVERMRRAEEKEQAKIQKRLAKHKASDEDYDSSVTSENNAAESEKKAHSERKTNEKSQNHTENVKSEDNLADNKIGGEIDEDFDFTDIFKFPKTPKNEEITKENSENAKPKSRAKAKAKSIIFGNEDVQDTNEADGDEENSSATNEKRRKSRPIKQKRAQADIKPDDEDDSVIDDYNNIDDAESVRSELDFKLSGISKRSTITFWLFVISCVFTMLPGLGLNLPQAIAPTAHTTIYLAINTLIFVIAIAANAKTVFKGFLSLLKLRPDIDTAVSISVIACAIQLAVSFSSPQSVRAGEGYLYYSLSLLALYLNLRGKKSMFLRVRSNFETVATTGTKQSCFSMKGKRSAELTDMTSPENVNVVCSRNVLNLHDFLYNSFSEDPSDRISRIFAPIGLCLAIVVGGIMYFVKGGDLSLTFGCIAAVTAMCVPLCSVLTVNKPLAKACKTVKEYGGLLSGYNSIESFHDVEYVVVNDYDLFPSGSIELLNLRAVGEESIDNVVMDAAALVMAAGGPLGDVFDRMIEGRVKSLKAVSGITYTDAVGITGNVGGDKIDVGTRAMMENLGEINLPDEEIERKIAKKNCFAVYIARNDNLCGMLIVKYTAKDEAITEQLQKLTDNGVTLLVNSCDPNISEELVEGLFDLNENTVHVMSSEAVMIYEQETAPRESDNSMLAHHNSLAGLCAALNSAKRLTGVISLSVILQTVGVVLGLAVLIYFSFIGSSLILPVNILIYQIFCSLAVTISSSRRIL